MDEDHSLSFNLNPKDTVIEELDNIDKETVNLEKSVHEIKDHYQQQDALQQLISDKPPLDADTEAEYEDQYAVQV